MTQSFDVVIAGGAVMGSSLAYHLARDSGFKGSILVIDKDMTYQRAASALSLSSIRQQFTTAINIRASLYGIKFLREAPEILGFPGDPAPVHVQENGYLYIASAAGEPGLREAHGLQISEGADIELIDPAALAARYPWLNCESLALASLGRTGEGWFDGYALMQAFRKKARALGALYREAEITGLEIKGAHVTGVRLSNGERIGCGAFVNCAGASGARQLAAMAGAQIPVYAKKRCVFTFQSPQKIEHCPLLIDTSGVYMRTEGEQYVCGVSPDDLDDSDHAEDFEVDWSIFEDTIWPALALRVPGFESLRPGRAWAGHYDMNLFDHNAIAGALPGCDNSYIACGFSGHGMQQSPAIGRGLAELITHGRYTSLDLSGFAFERIALGRPVLERNVI